MRPHSDSRIFIQMNLKGVCVILKNWNSFVTSWATRCCWHVGNLSLPCLPRLHRSWNGNVKVLLSIALLLTKLLRTACFWLEVIIEVGLSSYGRESGKRMLGRNFSPNKKKGRVGEKKKESDKKATEKLSWRTDRELKRGKNNIQLMCFLNVSRGIPLPGKNFRGKNMSIEIL